MLCGLIQPRHLEKEINFPRATLVGYSNAIYLRLCHPSINYTLRLAVKTSRRPSEGLYISLNKFCDQVNHIFEGCYYTKASLAETTVLTTSSREVPILSKASLVVTTLAMATRSGRRRRFFTGEDRGLRLIATPKGPARTSQREPGSRPRRTLSKLR